MSSEFYRAESFGREILPTKSLILRPFEKSDAADVTALANNFKIASMLNTMPYPYLNSDAESFIDRISTPEATGTVFAITLAESGEFIGTCGLVKQDEFQGMPAIGYWIGEAFWGNGYATEAARAVVDLFFKTGNQDELLLSVLSVNDRSKRVIEKCGGVFWKQSEKYSKLLDKTQSVEHYRITRESWMGAIAA